MSPPILSQIFPSLKVIPASCGDIPNKIIHPMLIAETPPEVKLPKYAEKIQTRNMKNTWTSSFIIQE
jgi:hypothetical protein